MKNIMLFAYVLLCALTVCELSAQSLPETAMGKPKVFLNEEISWSWEDVAADRSWGELSNKPWKVYIDREGVSAYTQPNSSSSVKKTCHFMEAYHIAKIENGYALLFTQSVSSLSINADAKACGWVSVDELLLWTVCPRTPNQVYKKALIVKDIEATQSGEYTGDRNPPFYKSPTQKIDGGYKAIELQIYFVFKENSKSALMFLGRSLDGDVLVKRHGWMRRAEYTNWNERLCFEPNFGDEVKGQFAAIFDEQSKAQVYKRSGIGTMKPIWKEALPSSRWPSNFMRFPVLDINSQFVVQVATINSFSSGSGSTVSTEKLAELQAKLELANEKLRTVNVVFVMDGTASMKEYFRPMAVAINSAMQHESMAGSSAKINFGAVVYRNYADEADGRLVEKKPITSDYKSVEEWLISRADKCGSAEQVDSYEAMFYGLDKAADMFTDKRMCNFIILVGDAASKDPDPKGLTIQKIASKFSGKEINFVAFQVNHPLKDAYDEYSSQVNRIMLSELSTIRNQKILRKDFVLKNNLLEYVYDSGWPVISAGCRFADPGKSEQASTLESLVERKLLDFKELATANRENFNKKIDEILTPADDGGSKATAVTKDFEDYLLSVMSPEDIKLLKESRSSIKLKGYTSRVAANNPVFTTSVFMSQSELELLIRSLESLNKNTTGNPRKDLQDALINLALIYIGQIKNPGDINIDDLMQAMKGIGKGTGGKNPLNNINIKQLTDPNVVSQRIIEDFKMTIAEDVKRLRKLQTDKSCLFKSNDEVYYYILVDDMPLQGE